MIKSALSVLEDGTQFHGRAIGATGTAVGEVVFNTPMIGYQETSADSSYSRQTVALTYPHVGNVGTNAVSEESSQVYAQGLVIRDLPLIASNFRNAEDLSSYPKRHNIVAIVDIGTHKLTRLLREKGTQDGRIIAGDSPDAQLTLEKAKAFPGLNGTDLVEEVITAETHSWTQGSWTLAGDLPEAEAESELPFHVVAYDFGVKRNILCMLVDRGCRPTVVPAQTSAEGVPKTNPDGTFLSNGSGDPAPCDYAVDATEKFLETDILVFGICPGHQLLAPASGAKTIKTKFGHHSGNHLVKDTDNSVVMITAQNHGFVVGEAILPASLRAIHKSLFDGTLQGIHCTDKPASSSQGHPEVSPGSYDATSLLDHLIELTEPYRQSAR